MTQFNCQNNKLLRITLSDYLDKQITNFKNLTENDKMWHILNPSTTDQISKTSTFIIKSLELSYFEDCKREAFGQKCKQVLYKLLCI